MVLAKPEILTRIRKGRVRIEPFDEQAIGPASIGLTLDNRLRVFNTDQHITQADIDYKTLLHSPRMASGRYHQPLKPV